MLSWISSAPIADVADDLQPTAGDEPPIEPPETPAPLFAVRAFKYALFGTPQPPQQQQQPPPPLQQPAADRDREPNKLRRRSHDGEEQRDQGRQGSNHRRATSANTSGLGPVDEPAMLRRTSSTRRHSRGYEATKKIGDAATSSNEGGAGAGAGAAKPTGILMTPGTAPTRRKTVSFDGPEAEHDASRRKGPAGRSGLPTNYPGKYPSPWTPRVNHVLDESKDEGHIRARSAVKLQRDQEAQRLNRSAPTAAPAPSPEDSESSADARAPASPRWAKPRRRAVDDTDVTLDLNLPRSESGRYWQAQYQQYSSRSEHETRKLILKQQSTKQYARKKDAEATALVVKLNDERRRHHVRESTLDGQLTELRERLQQSEAERTKLAGQLHTAKKDCHAMILELRGKNQKSTAKPAGDMQHAQAQAHQSAHGPSGELPSSKRSSEASSATMISSHDVPQIAIIADKLKLPVSPVLPGRRKQKTDSDLLSAEGGHSFLLSPSDNESAAVRPTRPAQVRRAHTSPAIPPRARSASLDSREGGYAKSHHRNHLNWHDKVRSPITATLNDGLPYQPSTELTDLWLPSSPEAEEPPRSIGRLAITEAGTTSRNNGHRSRSSASETSDHDNDDTDGRDGTEDDGDDDDDDNGDKGSFSFPLPPSLRKDSLTTIPGLAVSTDAKVARPAPAPPTPTAENERVSDAQAEAPFLWTTSVPVSPVASTALHTIPSTNTPSSVSATAPKSPTRTSEKPQEQLQQQQPMITKTQSYRYSSSSASSQPSNGPDGLGRATSKRLLLPADRLAAARARVETRRQKRNSATVNDGKGDDLGSVGGGGDLIGAIGIAT